MILHAEGKGGDSSDLGARANAPTLGEVEEEEAVTS